MSELQGLQLNVDEFRKRGCEILALVVDAPNTNAKVVADLGLDFRVLADPKLEAIDAYALRHRDTPAGDISRPASFLLDETGVIRWRDLTENYRIRPHPATVLAELERLS